MTAAPSTSKPLKRGLHTCTTEISKERRNWQSKYSGQQLGLRVESHILLHALIIQLLFGHINRQVN